MPPPAGYVDISTALYSRGRANVIGIVVDVFGDAFKTGGSSLCITFTLKDSNLDSGHSWDGLKVKYFNDDRASLPPVKQHDVVLLQNIRITIFNGKPLAVASQHDMVPWAIYRRESDAATTASPISGPQPFEPSFLEKKYALTLLNRTSAVDVAGHQRAVETFHTRSHTVQASVPSPKSYGQKQFSLIKDVKERTFVILVGEIVGIYQNDSEKVTIYITDYTTNKGLWDYGNDDDDGREGDRYSYLGRPKRKRNGPSGQMTLQVTLWNPHASYARQLESSQIVRLYNVNIKRSRINGNLEASLHTDRYHPDSVNIRKVDVGRDEHARALRDRKKEYWEKHGKKEVSGDSENPTKPKKSRNKQQQKKQETKKEEGQKPLETSKRTNPHIQAMNMGIKCQRLEDILTIESHNIKSPDGVEYRLPFQNLCYRATIRVVDFFPPNLEDFAVPDDSEQARLPGSDDDEEDNPNGFTRWIWRFCLLVEAAGSPPQGEPKKRMPLFVSGHDAVHLMDIDAANLRTNKKALKSLKEKLFILWGDLEELKAKAAADGNSMNPESWGPVSMVPFTCCIKEYGVKCSHDTDADDEVVINHDFGCSHEGCFGWERRFAMFGTTIHAP